MFWLNPVYQIVFNTKVEVCCYFNVKFFCQSIAKSIGVLIE